MILRRRPPRLKGLPLQYLLPNLITVLALCSGLTAVRFALLDQWQAAVTAIMVAGILDGLDGRLARLMGGGSKFGAELDSLSDFVSFGAAPALIMYMWSTYGLGGFGWAASMFVAVCCALRLARFNTMIDADKPAFAYNYFTGVPAPAGGGLALLPMMISFEWPDGPFQDSLVTSLWLVAVGLLMVSRLPTFAFKKVKIPHSYVLPVLVGAGILAAALFSAPWMTLMIIGIVYVGSFPISYLSFRRLTVEAARITGAPAPDPTSEETPPPPA